MATKIVSASSTPPEDELLVERIQGGDKEAFYALYRRYARYVAGVAYRIMGSTSEVDDVVQETFIMAMRKINQIKKPEHVKLWLVTIAVRLAHRRARRTLKCDSSELGQVCEEGTYVKPDAAAELFLLRRVLSRLPDKLLAPWVLFRIEGMTLEEVSQATHCSLATTKRRVVKAESAIRRKIDDV